MLYQAFFGQNPSYSSKFCELARTFLGHRAILARENYKILIGNGLKKFDKNAWLKK